MLINSLIVSAANTLKSRRGATAIEYGLIAAGIAIVIAGVMTLLGDQLETLFNDLFASV
ncbi:Flp family type IVb pilin [Azospirillum sp. SYSU D00513]|uniref:Flp family type IVb pilin n=1 Tax=Azospirillum sp. SYSU D00513 TaxID=2812561 RepID=UPI001A96F210|nr:Flp family type IVb pilin [Azospirillum sp. SYSU D00513]